MKFGIKEVMDITLFNLTTGAPALHLDTLKISNLEEVANTVYAVGGKGAPKLIGWDSNREVTLQIEDALASMESFGIFFGSTISSAEQAIAKRERLIADSAGDVTLSTTPVADSWFVYEEDGTAVTLGETPLSGLKLTVGTAADEGDAFIVYYDTTVSSNIKSFNITSNDFPGTYKMVGSTVVRNEEGLDIPFQVVIPRLKIMPGMSLTFEAEGDPSVFSMTWEALKDPNEDVLVKVIQYGTGV